MIRDTSGQDVVLKSTPAWKRPRNLQLGAAAIAVATFLAWGASSWWRTSSVDGTVSLSQVNIAQVERGDLIRDLVVQGRVVAANSPTLFSPAQGIVKFAVKAGDTVQAGQLLAEVDSPELDSELAQQRALLTKLDVELQRQKIQAKRQQLENRQRADLAKVTLIAAQRERKRAELSMEKQIISQLDFEKASDDLARAQLEYDQAEQNAALEQEALAFETQTLELQLSQQKLQVEELERKVKELRITSPVDGTVGSLAVTQRSAVARNAPLITVVDLSSFELEAAVPENYADDLGLAMAVEINLGGRKLPGEITAISPEVIDNQVQARVRFTDQQPENLRQNLRLTARILLENRSDVILVRRGGFLDQSGGRYAWKLNGEGEAVRVPIQIGALGLNQVEIVSGLQEGDQIIISADEVLERAQLVALKD
ncbi:efflux transporter periplasmic adaptor subunit [Microbulbifer flavimaris]|uniref:Efflux transporter periplasmic adaptor subunit n=1 Tax=Microbulbifer flavimaris TaxID=1781068 RepID=A0ABX4I0A2_9GAMM|nr:MULTISPECIES: efflux RND transporter periplasmic adaptor subunit [Microbulbifer]KUJ83385.1 efflux transporter periplasmic adaptor subunit [Microbulbifer sp. ZGT114]PCO05541.1 efflux transporter periplasmic adaptor subunit [Microbulbifer flavimaris]